MKIEDWRTNNKGNEINTDANNEYVDNFDPWTSLFIMYLDFNNQYGHALSETIPQVVPNCCNSNGEFPQ